MASKCLGACRGLFQSLQTCPSLINTEVPSPGNTAGNTDRRCCPCCGMKVWMHAPLSMLQSLATPKGVKCAVNTKVPSPANNAELNPNSHWKVWMHAPVSMLHTQAASSPTVVNTEVPSPENTALCTERPAYADKSEGCGNIGNIYE